MIQDRAAIATTQRFPTPNPWLLSGMPNRRARMRLFCLPYAGAGGALYAKWPSEFPAAVDVCALTPPGRHNRLAELSHRHFRSYIRDLAGAIDDMLDVPYAIFGYSMGALMAFELARHLAEAGHRQPMHLIVGASPAPHVRNPVRSEAALSDDDVLSMMALPADIVAEPELRDMAVRVMRDDLEVLASYEFRRTSTLACPITVLGGDRDPSCPTEKLEAWRELSNDRFALEMFRGGHFFLKKHSQHVIRVVRQCLSCAEG